MATFSPTLTASNLTGDIAAARMSTNIRTAISDAGGVRNAETAVGAAILLSKLAATPLQTTQYAEGTALIADTEADIITITPTQYPCVAIITATALAVAAQTATIKLTDNANTILTDGFFTIVDASIPADYNAGGNPASTSGNGIMVVGFARFTGAPAGGAPLKIRGVRSGVSAGNFGAVMVVIS